jgi:transglutaminase superfamily protein
MMHRRTLVRALACTSAVAVAGMALASREPSAAKTTTESKTATESRTFRFTCAMAVQDIPAGAREISVWIPVPKTDDHQVVGDLKVTAPVRYQIGKEKEYGNSILHLTVDAPLPKQLDLELEARVQRRAYNALAQPRPGDSEAPPAPRDLAPNALVPTDGRIAELAAQVTSGATTPLAKARAIYEYVTDSMRYDKTGTGWGRGDAIRACDVKAGNCSDFHSLIIGMARASGIPARFVMGFPLPESAKQGEIPGYHCWAELYIEGKGWLPVDSSEANKHPEKREAFFGGLDANRLQLTVGRDLVLEPAAAKPLNFFIYPYVEIDGTPYDGVTRHYAFTEVGT